MIIMHDKDRKALEEMMKDVERYAAMNMHSEGTCPPRLYLHGIECKAMYSPRDMHDEEGKERFVDAAMLICIAHGADATVFLSEALMVAPQW